MKVLKYYQNKSSILPRQKRIMELDSRHPDYPDYRAKKFKVKELKERAREWGIYSGLSSASKGRILEVLDAHYFKVILPQKNSARIPTVPDLPQEQSAIADTYVVQTSIIPSQEALDSGNQVQVQIPGTESRTLVSEVIQGSHVAPLVNVDASFQDKEALERQKKDQIKRDSGNPRIPLRFLGSNPNNIPVQIE